MKNKMDTGGMPEKILNLSSYQLSLVSNLHQDKTISSKISKSAAGVITEYFNKYYDSLAKRNKYMHKHVYEFDRGGDKDSRLFKANIKTSSNVATIKYSFIQSKKPNRNGYVFRNKASVMENGKTVRIRPKNAKVLSFNINGEQIFTSKTVVIRYPGGKNVAGSFSKKLEEFMTTSKAKIVLKSSGFFKTIDQGISEESKSISRKIPKIIMTMDSTAKNSANKIAERLPRGVK